MSTGEADSVAAEDAGRDPWNEPAWAAVTRDLSRLPHALLLHGEGGLGKRAFATRLARLLLCAQPRTPDEPCGECQGCRLFAAGTHPDLHVVQPESFAGADSGLSGRYAERYAPAEHRARARPSAEIGVGQIRLLIDASRGRPHIAARRVLIVIPAEAMTLNAANSLLKLLEEPPPETVMMLATARASRLLATLRSRCVPVAFVPPPPAVGLAWLRQRLGEGAPAQTLLAAAHGVPRRAAALAGGEFTDECARLAADLRAVAVGRATPMAVAARWAPLDPALFLDWLATFVGRLIKYRLGALDTATGADPGIEAEWQRLANAIKLNELYQFLDVIYDVKRLTATPLDRLLLLEDMLIRWYRVTARASKLLEAH